MPSFSRSRWSGTCPAGAARTGSWPRYAATGSTCSRTCPHQSEVNRRIRWLWGAFEQLRAAWAAAIPPDPVQQIGTSALPAKHCSRVRGPDQWTGPGNDLAARFGRDGAHAEWFYGFRLAVRTDLGRRIVRAWSIVPAAVKEQEADADLICGDTAAIDALLLDNGFNGTAFAAQMATASIEVIIPPIRAQRRTMPQPVQRLIARFRNRVEASFKEITDQMELARHGAHSFEGLLTRTAATLAAHTLLLTVLPECCHGFTPSSAAADQRPEPQ